MKKILTTIFLIISGATGWILIEPTLSDDVINEEPTVFIEESVDKQVDQTIKTEAEEEVPVEQEAQTEEESLSQIVNTQAIVEQPQVDTAQATSKVATPQLLSGSFTNGKARYKATGQVFISGSNLSLVDLDSTNVPDGFIYLSNDLQANDAVRLDKLKGNVGNQNYSLPAGIDAVDYKYVLIWCRAFSSLVGYAELR